MSVANRVVSKHPRKQHKARARAPLHARQRFLRARLEKSLSKKYSRRSAQVRKGDTVKVMRGDFRNHEGKIASVNLKRESIEVDGVTVHKADGSEVARPVHPSNVMITKLELKDKMRTRKLGGG
ncbi:MAG: 50S ribosomal protein L24 [Euryarchaeota archaeon]|nr:50S ribosomal protein L24 [Euryarchaeota archaeon]